MIFSIYQNNSILTTQGENKTTQVEKEEDQKRKKKRSFERKPKLKNKKKI